MIPFIYFMRKLIFSPAMRVITAIKRPIVVRKRDTNSNHFIASNCSRFDEAKGAGGKTRQNFPFSVLLS